MILTAKLLFLHLRTMKPLVVFYILVVYIFLQFCWWAYLLVDLNQEVYEQKTKCEAIIESNNVNQFSQKQDALLSKLHHRWIMVAGEGTVFLILLVLGVTQTRKAFKKETALSQQQKNFLLSITHEFKSPLASIKLYLQTLQKRDLEKEKQQTFIQNAINDTERLNNLVENILTATKIENSSYVFHKEKINLSDVVNELALRFNQDQEKQKIVENHVEPNIFFNVDKLAFVSILLNILENAVKYSPTNSQVKLELNQVSNKIILKVSDEGIGIANDEKTKIFEKFYRSGNEETRKTKGTGLGLYIVKYLVEKHNGTISVKDNSPKGSIFEIVFNG